MPECLKDEIDLHFSTLFLLSLESIEAKSDKDFHDLLADVKALKIENDSLKAEVSTLENEECPCDLHYLVDQIRWNGEDITCANVHLGVLNEEVRDINLDV